MDAPSTSRRSFLAGVAGTAAAAVAGCLAPGYEPPPKQYERWVPSRVASGAKRTVRYVEPATLAERDLPDGDGQTPRLGALSEADVPLFEVYRGEPIGPDVSATDVEWLLYVGGANQPPRATVATGDFAADAIAADLSTRDWLSVDVDGDFRAFQHEGRRVVAVSDSRLLVTTNRVGEEPTDYTHALLDAETGVGRYADVNEAYGRLCEELPAGPHVTLSTVGAIPPNRTPKERLLRGLVPRGTSVTLDDDEVTVRFVAVFPDDVPVPVDAVHEWADGLGALDATSVATDERTAAVTATGSVAEIPLSAYRWDGASSDES